MSRLTWILVAVAATGLLGAGASFFAVGKPKEDSVMTVRLESAAVYQRTHRNTTRSFGK